MASRFHVTSTANRASITRHGLDWSRTDAARGIAGSTAPEVQGCFPAEDEFTADWFMRMNNTGGPVDVWEVSGVDEGDLLEFSGFAYLPTKIHYGQLRLVRTDIAPAKTREDRGRVDRTARTRRSSWPVPRPVADGAQTADQRRRCGSCVAASTVVATGALLLARSAVADDRGVDVEVEVGGWDHQCCGEAVERDQVVDLACLRTAGPDGQVRLSVTSHHPKVEQRVRGRVRDIRVCPRRDGVEHSAFPVADLDALAHLDLLAAGGAPPARQWSEADLDAALTREGWRRTGPWTTDDHGAVAPVVPTYLDETGEHER